MALFNIYLYSRISSTYFKQILINITTFSIYIYSYDKYPSYQIFYPRLRGHSSSFYCSIKKPCHSVLWADDHYKDNHQLCLHCVLNSIEIRLTNVVCSVVSKTTIVIIWNQFEFFSIDLSNIGITMCFVHRCTDVFWMLYCKIIKVFKKKSRSQICSGGSFKLLKAANLSYNRRWMVFVFY